MALRTHFLRVVNAAYLLALGRPALAFARATRNVAATQAQRLREMLAANADTLFGRAHCFGAINSVADFQRRVPVATYADLAPFVDRIAAGEANVLTRATVTVLEPTAGSTAKPKLIPCTAPYLAELGCATGPWLFDLLRSRPPLWGTRTYWSLSPAARADERTSGDVRIGFVDDTEYLGPAGRFVWQQKMAVPSAVGRITDVEAWRRATLLYLLAADDLGLISVWSPTFLLVLMRALSEQVHDLVQELPAARSREVVAALEKSGEVSGPALWPRLRLISCWTDGSARLFLPELRRWFPGVEIQGKGLIATEGVVSFPLGPTPIAAVASHFLEFEPLDAAERVPLLAHELEPGGRYSPILTTGGGLYRYRLSDVVTCVGRQHQAPRLRFDGKRDQTSDLVGEKLDAAAVEAALGRAAETVQLALSFALVTPGATTPLGYRLLVDSPADGAALARFGAEVERLLCDNFHYRYARELGQLAALAVIHVPNGWARYEAALAASGARLGSIKPLGLDASRDWTAILTPP
jgi:hypothetical protein